MTVRVRSKGTGGSPPQTSFSDTLNGADQPFFVGTDWYCVYDGTAGAFTGAQVQGVVNRGATGLTIGDTGGLNTNALQFFMLPNRPYLPLITGRSQRARVVYNRGAGAPGTVDCRAGLVILANPNLTGNGECYALSVAQSGGNDVLGLRRAVIFTGSVPAGWSNITLAAGDSFTLEAIVTPTQNTINVYLNDVLNQSIVDADATRPTIGGYGMCYVGFNNNQTLRFTNFSGRLA